VTGIGNSVYFDGDFGSVAGDELGVLNATTDTASMLKDLVPGSTGGSPNSSYPGYFTPLGGQIYFVANVNTTNAAICKTHGTAAGTAQASAINVNQPYGPSALTVLGHSLYFDTRTPAGGSKDLPGNLVTINKTQGDNQSASKNTAFATALQVSISSTDGVNTL